MLSTTVKNFELFPDEQPVYDKLYSHPSPFITKRPLDIFDLDRIVRSPATADSALIICYRDPRAMLCSRHAAIADDYFIGYDRTWFVNPHGDSTYTIPGIVDTHAAILRAVTQRPFHTISPLRYEDVVQNTEAVQSFITRVLGLECDGSFADFYKADLGEGLTVPLNEVRPVDESTIDKWQAPEHRERLRTQYARCPELYDINAFYGYGDIAGRWEEG